MQKNAKSLKSGNLLQSFIAFLGSRGTLWNYLILPTVCQDLIWDLMPKSDASQLVQIFPLIFDQLSSFVLLKSEKT